MNEKYNKPIMRMPVVTPEGVGDNGNGYSSKDLQESLPTNPSYNVYIGARYVPLIYQGSDGSANWEKDTVYEPLTIVLYNHETYTSKSFVPANILPTDTKYWVKTSNFNAEFMKIENMVSDLSQNVDSLNDDMKTAQDSISANANNISTNTADITAIKAVNQAQQTAIDHHTTSITEILEKNAQQDERISDLESKSSAASQNISNLTNEVNNLKTSQTEQDTKIEDIENTIEQQSTDISNIQSKNSQQDTSIAELQTGLNSANSNIITLQTDMQGVKDLNTAQGIDIDTLKNRSDSMEEAIETLQNTDTQHTASIQANATAIGGLNAKVQTNTDAIAALTTQGNQTAGAVTELATKNAQQDTAISQIQQAANTNMGNINTLTGEVSQLDTRMENAENEIQTILNNTKIKTSTELQFDTTGNIMCTIPNDTIVIWEEGTYRLNATDINNYLYGNHPRLGKGQVIFKYIENNETNSYYTWNTETKTIDLYNLSENTNLVFNENTRVYNINFNNTKGYYDFANISAIIRINANGDDQFGIKLHGDNSTIRIQTAETEQFVILNADFTNSSIVIEGNGIINNFTNRNGSFKILNGKTMLSRQLEGFNNMLHLIGGTLEMEQNSFIPNITIYSQIASVTNGEFIKNHTSSITKINQDLMSYL